MSRDPGHWTRTVGFSILVMMAGLLCLRSSASAHPMGNFSINHFSVLELTQSSVRVDYVLDMAEIPAFQEFLDHELIAEPDHPRVAAYRARKAEELRQGLSLTVAERPVQLTTLSSRLTFPPGAGGLPTLRIEAVYEGPLPVGSGSLHYEDGNYPRRVGWKEIIATGDGSVSLSSSTVPGTSRSNGLTTYSADLLQAPPQDLKASLSFAVLPQREGTQGNPLSFSKSLEKPSTLAGAFPGSPRNSFTELVATKRLGFGILMLALAVALGLGALHALEPGHGKTVIAAYLVGSRGTARQALLLGLIVTASHTAGVFLLGAVTLYASRYIVPDRLYPWLGVISGLIIAGLGFSLFLQRRAGSSGFHSHRHSHRHAEAHGGGPHSHEAEEHLEHRHGRARHTFDGGDSLRDLLALGITGGIVPCPAALVVLLSALSLNRTGFGLFLIVAFSVGLAVVLIGIGLLMVYARHALSHFRGDTPLITRWLPLTSSAVITVFGMAIAVEALLRGGFLRFQL
jgi:nickel/cobalt exporter